MGARFAMNRLKRSDQDLAGLNFTIGGSGERRVSATALSLLPSNADVKALSQTQGRISVGRDEGECPFFAFPAKS